MFFYSELENTMKNFTTTGGFLTVKSGELVNTMTISWGFVGFLWAKPHFVVVVRPQRYTKTLIDKAESFTVSIPFGTMKEQLGICGTKSGRDIDKSKIVTFKDAKAVKSPVVDGCDVYYECAIKYTDPMNSDALSDYVKENFYKGDFHDFYFGEIIECYKKEE